MDVLKIVFPALMVCGALGSLVVNLISRGEAAISLQWIGAAMLYQPVGGGSAQTDDGDQAEEHRQRQQHAEQSLGVLFHRMLSPFILAENLHNLR